MLDPMQTDDQPIALVVLNMGGPDSLAAIEPFLANLFRDRDLINLPLGRLFQRPFARLISKRRAPKVRPNYAAIGGASPQLFWTEKQAQGIAQRLGPSVRPFVAMRYWKPFARQTVRAIADAGLRKAVVLSLYPHYTSATTGSSLKDFFRAVAQEHPQLETVVIKEWFDWPPYHQALASCIRQGLQQFPADKVDEIQILFSAHALPQKFIDRGDPYLRHIQATVAGVMAAVGDYDSHIAFQSRSGPVRWMRPGTDETLLDLANQGHRAVLMVPVSFVSDHIETLHEIDIEYAQLAKEVGIDFFVRAPSLNDRADFLTALADLVGRHLLPNAEGFKEKSR